MENTNKAQNFDIPQMCIKCNNFYANIAYGRYCSSCFKEQGAKADVKEIAKTEILEVGSVTEKQDEVAVVKQEDHSRCWKCTKKAGMMGFKCKCGYTFCKKHRLPEKHVCDFNFQKEGKSRLAKKNPNIQGDKIERI